jgi:hypothetical protein
MSITVWKTCWEAVERVLKEPYLLDEWQYHDSLEPGHGQTGHLYSTLLDDGSILTLHNNYLTMGLTLIRWRP